jgi:hypothetical protein
MIKLTTRKHLREPTGLSSEDGLAAVSPEFRELLLTNPAAYGDETEPVQVLGLKDNQVIGRMNLVKGEICVEGQVLPVLWGSGYIVPPEHRPTGVGLMILLRMQGLPYTLGVIGASQMAAPLYQKLKWIELVAPRFVLLRRLRPVLERYLGPGLLTALGCALGNVGLKALGRLLALRTRMATRGLVVEPVARMPESLDAQLHRIDKPAFCRRSAAWLNWILSARSGHPALFLVKNRERKTVGYFLITHRHHDEGGGGKWRNFLLGSVKDWMTFDPAAVSDAQLVLLAINELMRRQVDVIDVCAAEPETGLVLRRCGLKEVGGMHFHFRPLPNTPLAKAELHRLEAWRFRPADGDYFMF